MALEEVASVETQEVAIASGLTPDEVEQVLSMAAASGLFSSSEMTSAESMAWDSAYGNGSEPDTFLKATINKAGQDQVIGFICFGPIPYWPGNYEMYAIAVDPDFQRLGIGSALIAEMNRLIDYENGQCIFLETKTDRAFENARLFCEANNFIPEHRYIKQFTPEGGGIVYRYDMGPDADELN